MIISKAELDSNIETFIETEREEYEKLVRFSILQEYASKERTLDDDYVRLILGVEKVKKNVDK